MDTRVVLAGIDEAGLGPLLGSLALGHAWLEVPADALDPWRALRPCVARTPSKRARFAVGDSKLIFQRTARGARRLEETVLAFHAAARGGALERDARAFLQAGGTPADALQALPWAGELAALPADCPLESLELGTEVLARALRRARIEVLSCGVRLTSAAELNESWARTGNKAETVWELVSAVLARVWELRGRGAVHATVDMLGGRRRYGSRLARAFPGASVSLVEESALRSAYLLEERGGPGRMQLEFRVKGESHSFAVALASCCAKYARELEMAAFNRFFTRLQPGLAPTAGYRQDGARWLAEAAPALAQSGVARSTLVRER